MPGAFSAEGWVQWPSDATVLVYRGDAVESRHCVSYALVDASGRVHASAGDIDEPIYLRSAAKPLFCAAVVASGAFDHYGLTDVDIALGAGSHSGQAMHVRAVGRMLSAIGLAPSALACGAHPPLDPRSAALIARSGKPFRPIHNNCSGSHTAVLALARYRGVATQGYLSPAHPAEREILAACADMLGMDREDMVVAVDGCGMPALGAPLRAIAQTFARFSNGGDAPYALAMRRVVAAMVAHPDYVGGTGRFDTALMRAASPRIACKSGAEGVHATALLNEGLGLAVKVRDGNDRAVPPFVVAKLAANGALTTRSRTPLTPFLHPAVLNYARTEVGRITTAL